ncbi:MAG: bifunctional phosphoribosylaminoimidazolecarboxamide formyltransferase/IMP cyclohydrolase [Bdellovibrionota bacterium]
MKKIRRALISVSDKNHIDQLAKVLAEHDVEIFSSGGTFEFLKSKGFSVTEISTYTGFPEIMDGRVKTLHPKIHGGILSKHDHPQHIEQMKAHDIVPFDVVVVNLYPFEKTVAQHGVTQDQAIEKIDVGGPTMIRAAAKNFHHVTVLTNDRQYEEFAEQMDQNQGSVSLEFRRQCSVEAFARTRDYDEAICNYFMQSTHQETLLDQHFSLTYQKHQAMRYGENPHQQASFYLPQGETSSLFDKVLQGKELSYNNLLDAHGALELMMEFQEETAVGIFKHSNPCGLGLSQDSLAQAYERALACDPISAFGGIVALTQKADAKTAQAIVETFTEIVIAPAFEQDALDVFAKKKNLRVLEIPFDQIKKKWASHTLRTLGDGLLVQQRDQWMIDVRKAKVVTTIKPTQDQWKAMELAWKVVKHVKSNAIVLADQHQTLGIGAGQMSRVDSTIIAVQKHVCKTTHHVAVASDAFFPFRDSIDQMSTHGIKCVIQPGGSIRDQEVIDAANEHGMCMLFTSYRHFKH